jgi:hypothetical protein
LRFASGAVAVPFRWASRTSGTLAELRDAYGLVIAGRALLRLKRGVCGRHFDRWATQVGVFVAATELAPSNRRYLVDVSDGILIVEIALMLGLVALLVRRSTERALTGRYRSVALYPGGVMQFYLPPRRIPTEVPVLGDRAPGLSWF